MDGPRAQDVTTVIVVPGRAGTRDVLRSTESAAKQTLPAAVVSLEAGAGTAAAAFNGAADGAKADQIAVLKAPWRLLPHAVERFLEVLESAPKAAMAVPRLRLDAPDGRPLRQISLDPTLSAILSSPLTPPPVILLRRGVWDAAGPLDVTLGELAWCEWWLRFAALERPALGIPEPLARLTVTDRAWWPPQPATPLDTDVYRRILEKHRGVLDREMTELVVAQEVRFGRLLGRHREALRTRDAELARLDTLRAEAAHHRAFLQHHGRLALEWGDLRRCDPVSRDWGYDRGVPVDRRYIEDFLAACSSDIRGRVLEVQEDDFTRRFGGPRVVSSEVVDVDDANPRATVIADLRSATALADGAFDAIILTQTLHVIDDMAAVLAECHRILAPGGLLLATLPAASRVCLEYGEDGDLWRVTPAGARHLFERAFGPTQVEVTTFGNVLTNVAFLHGLACGELSEEEFASTDPYYPLVTGVRARKADGSPQPAGTRDVAVLMYHRVDDETDVHDLTVPAALLTEQLQWLSRECRVVPLEELLTSAWDTHSQPRVAITFDDGYLDALEEAAPALERLGLPATMFVTTRWLEEPGEYWWDALERVLLRAATPPDLTIEIVGSATRLPTRTAEERRAAHDRLHAWLVHASLADRDRALSALHAWSGGLSTPRRRPLLADELRRLARAPGISIGAHSVNHLALPDQPAAVQEAEVLQSVRSLERLLGTRVTTFAFPYGAVDRASADAARAICSWSVGCDPRPVPPSFDAARVPRLEVKRWEASTLRNRLWLLFDPDSSD